MSIDFSTKIHADDYAIPICKLMFAGSMPLTGEKVEDWPFQECDVLLNWCNKTAKTEVLPIDVLSRCNQEKVIDGSKVTAATTNAKSITIPAKIVEPAIPYIVEPDRDLIAAVIARDTAPIVPGKPVQWPDALSETRAKLQKCGDVVPTTDLQEISMKWRWS